MAMDAIMASPLVKTFLAGSLSGTFSTVLFQPLDVVKTVLQSNSTANDRMKRVGVKDIITSVVKNERVFGLWRGFKPSVMRCVPGVGMYFSSLHMLKSTFLNDERPSAYQSLILGASARALTATTLIPITVVKTRFESGKFGYSSVGRAMHSIYTLEGRRGLTAGLSATLIRDAPFSALYLMFYNESKSALPDHLLAGSMGSSIRFSCGIFAGICASVITQPADVIKTNMQVCENKASLRTAILYIHTNHGIKGFFRGLGPRVLRRTLIAAMAWTVFEEVMKTLNLKT